jgi:acetyltransferase-like isoleucine patch superfamily enzyme
MPILKSAINIAYRIAGRRNYDVDDSLKDSELLTVLLGKGICCLRGFFKGLLFSKRAGMTFVSSGTSIIGYSRIYTGRNLNIEQNVVINALAKDGIHFGDNVSIRFGTVIECAGVLRNLGERLDVGNNVGFSPGCFISVRGKVHIGNNTIFGPGAKLFSENHNFMALDIPISAQGETRKGVHIGDNSWIGGQAIILDGVTLGEGCVVAANAVVTKSFAAGSVLAGIPAKQIGARYEH